MSVNDTVKPGVDRGPVPGSLFRVDRDRVRTRQALAVVQAEIRRLSRTAPPRPRGRTGTPGEPAAGSPTSPLPTGP